MNGIATCTATTDATLRGAMERLDANRAGIVVIVDEDGHLAGTVTDGDIRRALLAKKPLETPVRDVMSADPVVARQGSSEPELRALMVKHRVDQVPLVDDQQRPVDLVTLRDLAGPSDSFAAAVIMAGGEGTRLRPLTDKLPKPLLQIGDTTIIETLVRNLAAAGVQHIYVTLHYKGELIQRHLGDGERYGTTIEYIEEEEKLGTAASLARLPEPVKGPLLVINGDIMTTTGFKQLYDYHLQHRCVVTAAAIELVFKIPYGVLTTANHLLVGLEEKPEARFLCSAGIYVLEPDVLRFVDGGKTMDMPDLLKKVLNRGLPTTVFPILEKWIDVGTLKDLERARVEFGDAARG